MQSQSIVKFGAPLEQTSSQTPEPKDAEVLLRVTHCGVCHSDVHLHDGYFDLGGGNHLDVTGGLPLPFTLGHEIEGVVEAIGPDVSNAAPGDKRVAFPWIGCSSCPVCARGDEHMCNASRGLGVAAPGGYADFVLVPHERYLLDYDGIPDGLAATYMCSGLTAYGAMRKVRLGASERVLVVGLGGVGWMGLQFARAMFPQGPLAADINPEKRKAAKTDGAHAVYDPGDTAALGQLHADTGGGVAAAVDFVGSEASLKFAQSAVRRGGQVIIVGLFGGSFSMPIPLFPLRAISIGGSYVGSLQETHDMLKLVRGGAVSPIPIETRPLSQASKTLDDLRKGNIMGRVVLSPSERA